MFFARQNKKSFNPFLVRRLSAMATSLHHWATRPMLVWAALLLLAPGAPAAGAADASNDDCLACHSDKSLTATRGGRTVSRFVDGKRFSSSVHGVLSCTSCHADLAGKDLPHGTPVARVECGTCHSDEQKQHAASLHGRAIARGDPLAPHCVDCHGNHDI